jgi:hypothetical protein
MADGDMSPLREAAVQLHEMYVELRNAGFSRSEAMELVAKVLGQMAAAQNEQKDD